MFVIVSSGPRHSRNSFIKFPKSDSTLALFFQYLTVVGVPMDYELPCNPLDVQQKHPEKRHNSLKNRYKFSCPGSKSRLVILIFVAAEELLRLRTARVKDLQH